MTVSKMTFSMSDHVDHKIDMIEEEEDAGPQKSIKELEEEKAKEKQRQARNDDIALVVCMVILVTITVVTVLVKVTFLDEPAELGVTFKPLTQNIKSREMYTGNGYLPCNGYVPCQPGHLSPHELEERVRDAMPCHDFMDRGEGPEGCW